MRDNGIRFGEKLKDLLFPRHCPVCDDILPFGDKLACDDCIAKIQYIKPPACRKCGKQLYDEGQIYCGDCTRRNHIFDYGIALYDYQSMRKSIYRFKYRHRGEYAQFYAKDIYRHLKHEICAMGADAFIPVPLHRTRQDKRGYNQAELVSRELSKLFGIPTRADLVKRNKKTLPQKQLNAISRQNNLKKAFNIGSDVVKLNKTILVDDIYTTGSTLDAVASELRRYGVEKIYYITLCIGEGI